MAAPVPPAGRRPARPATGSVATGCRIGQFEFPTGQDQVRIVERSTSAHVVAGVALPDLGPRGRIAELLVGDVPQRVARLDGVVGRRRRLDHRRRCRDGTRRCDPGRKAQCPADLDVGGVGEALPTGHHLAEIRVDDRVGDLEDPPRIAGREVDGDRVDRFTRRHDVDRCRRLARRRRGTRHCDVVRRRRRRNRRFAERGRRRCAGAERRGQRRRRRHHGQHRHEPDGDEPGGRLRPAHAAHVGERQAVVADGMHDLDDRRHDDHRQRHPHHTQAQPDDAVDHGVVRERARQGVTDVVRAPLPRGISPGERVCGSEPGSRHGDQTDRDHDDHGEQRGDRRREAGPSVRIAFAHVSSCPFDSMWPAPATTPVGCVTARRETPVMAPAPLEPFRHR